MRKEAELGLRVEQQFALLASLYGLDTGWRVEVRSNKRKPREKKREKTEKEREKRREQYVQGNLLSICIQFAKRKIKFIGRNAQNLKKWLLRKVYYNSTVTL